MPAFAIDVVDTTGCGDAFSAGFLRGLALGRSRGDAATLGSATAALVAQGLGTDAGDFDLAAADAFAAATPTRRHRRWMIGGLGRKRRYGRRFLTHPADSRPRPPSATLFAPTRAARDTKAA